MSKGGDSPAGNTTTTNVSDPWSGQQPYLTQGFQQAQNLFNQGGPGYYPGQSYAGPTDLQLTGIENEANLGLNGTSAQAGANGALGNILNNNWLTSNASNPLYMNAALGGMNVNTGGYFAPIASGQQSNMMGVMPLAAIAGGMNSNPLMQGGYQTSGNGQTQVPASSLGGDPAPPANGNTWMDGDGNMIAPPTAGQIAQNTTPNSSQSGNTWRDGDGNLIAPPTAAQIAQNTTPYGSQPAQQGTSPQPSQGNVGPGGVLTAASQGGLNNSMGVAPISSIASGQNQNNGGQLPLSLASLGLLNNTQGQNVLGNIASGANNMQPGMQTLANIAGGSNLSAQNPYFQQMAATTAASVLPQLQGQFAAGNRMDSGLASRAAAEGLGDSIGSLAYNNYQQGLQQQQSAASNLASLGQNATAQQASAAGQLGQLGQQNLSQQLGAANSLGSLGAGNLNAQLQAGNSLAGIGAQNISNQLGAANSLGQFGQQNIQNQLAASGQLSNIGQNNIANQLSASTALTNLGFGNIGTQMTGAQGLSQNFENAAQNQLGALGLAPSVSNMDYQQAAALQDAGTTAQGLNQSAINDAMARYNYGQQQPYTNLQNYMQNIQGNYGGTSTSTSPYFQNGTANALSTGIGALTLGNQLSGGQLQSGLGNIFGNLFGGSGGGINSIADLLNGGI